MTIDRQTTLSKMTTRQKMTLLIFVLVVLFLVWQIYGMFAGSSPAPRVTKTAAKRPGNVSPSGNTPIQSSFPKNQGPMTAREMALLQLQQQTEAKYLATLTELQMLKLQREVAVTNKDIMSAKLDTITAQKRIVDLLKPPPAPTPAAYAQNLVKPTGTAQPVPIINVPPPSEPTIAYTVISVSQINYKWNAVLGSGGSLYNVSVGDILPVDQSRVVSIDKTGVVLQKDNTTRKVSLVPII